MHIKQQFLSLGKKARGGDKFSRAPDRIIIHWIGPYPGQDVTAPWDWWESGSDGKGVAASAHFIVKGEDVLQALPLDEIGYHSGDSRNAHSIGIEVIPKNAAGEFATDTLSTVKELIAKIRSVYPGLLLDRHYDGVQKKDCPRFFTPVTGLVGEGGRVANPAGGDERWIIIRNFFDGVGDN